MTEKQLLQSNLPGSDLIAAGLRDLSQNHETTASLLVSIGAPRLCRIGINVAHPSVSAERRLYEYLQRENPEGVHSRYNSLIRRLISFERTAECAK